MSRMERGQSINKQLKSYQGAKSAWMNKLFTKSAFIRLVIRVIHKMNVLNVEVTL